MNIVVYTNQLIKIRFFFVIKNIKGVFFWYMNTFKTFSKLTFRYFEIGYKKEKKQNEDNTKPNQYFFLYKKF